MESMSKIGCTTLFGRVCAWSLYVSRRVSRVSARWARSTLDRIVAATSSPRFRTVVDSWDATNAVLKLTEILQTYRLVSTLQPYRLLSGSLRFWGRGKARIRF